MFQYVLHLRPKNLTDLTTSVSRSRKYVVQQCRLLDKHGWLRFVGKGQSLRPVCWVPKEYQKYVIAELEEDYAMAPYGGEFLLGRVLQFLVDAPRFVLNARPQFLTNPKTKEPLELDIFAPGVIAAEFNGPQHYTETAKYADRSAVDDTMARDVIKEGLCARHKIPLIVVTAQNLGIESVKSALPPEVPLHVVDLKEPYAAKLNHLCTLYRRKSLRAGQKGATRGN